MTERKGKGEGIDVKALLAGDEGFIRTVVQRTLQEMLEAEMTEAVGAAKGERTAARLDRVPGRGVAAWLRLWSPALPGLVRLPRRAA